MRLIKMKVARNCTPERTRYSYPDGWDSKKVIFGPVYEKGAKERGQDFQWIVFGVADADAPLFVGTHGQAKGAFTFEAAEITKEEACTLGDPWIDQVQRITDPNVVLAVCDKALKGQPLTAQERDAVDPATSTPGISTSPSFTEALNAAIIEKAKKGL